MTFTLTINGKSQTVDAEGEMPLLWVLRDELNMKGTKFGCGAAYCGACTVHLDGVAVRGCQTPLSEAAGHNITTVEGIGQTAVGARVQKAWLEVDVMQCGYCQAGQIMTATALLSRNPKPSDDEIDMEMNGNLCRCATYNRIRQAVKRAAGLEHSEAVRA
jgi:isoquinoline 1-oxidoreductase alpha subunit